MSSTPSALVSSPWVGRFRFVVATALLWAALHLVGGLLLPRGLDRPLVLGPAGGSVLGGPAIVLLLWLGAAAATILLAARGPRRPLMVLGLALSLWAFEGGASGGTMDDWLMLRNPRPGPPTPGPYWLLLVDYLYLLLGVGGAWLIAARLASRHGAGAIRTWFANPQRGVPALLLATAVAGLVMFVLTGSPTGVTLRLQVYFAVGVGCLAGVYAAERVVGVRDLAWYWLLPILLGIVGVVVAGLGPALRLPPEYRGLNNIPAWGLARGLPVEVVGAGLLATLWLLRPGHGHAARTDAA